MTLTLYTEYFNFILCLLTYVDVLKSMLGVCPDHLSIFGTGNLNFISCLDWPSSSADLCLPSAGIIGRLLHLAFHVGARNPNSDWVCIACNLLTKLSSQTLNLIFKMRLIFVKYPLHKWPALFSWSITTLEYKNMVFKRYFLQDYLKDKNK